MFSFDSCIDVKKKIKLNMLGGITFERIGTRNESCGFNPFCHLKQFFGLLILCVICGCVLCSIGFGNLTTTRKLPAKWKGETKITKEKLPSPCCETKCECNNIDFPEAHGNKCCKTANMNGDNIRACSDVLKPVCREVNCIDPCYDCISKREYELNGQQGTKVRYSNRQPSCSSSIIEGTIYANPDNINDTSSISTGNTRKAGMSSISMGCVCCLVFICTIYALYRSGKFIASKF